VDSTGALLLSGPCSPAPSRVTTLAGETRDGSGCSPMVPGLMATHAHGMTSSQIPSTPVDQPAIDRPAPRPQLRRSGTDRMAGGVCGGLAEYSGIDPLLWRVGFVGLTVAGGAGILVYLLLVLMPSSPLPAGEIPSPVEQLVGKAHAAASGFRRAG
jgi:phage shock protein C